MASDYPNAAAGDDRRGSLYSQMSPIGTSAPTGLLGPDPADGSGAPEAIGSGAGAPTASGDAPTVTSPTQATATHEVPREVNEVLQSEIGIVTMLNRLKQSIGTAKEFGLFLKKRAQLEEDYSAGMRKLARSTQDSIARSDPSQGSSTFGSAFGEMMDIHNRMADNGYQFSMSLHQMHEDLLELASIAEKNRKGWKQTGLAAEQRVADLETATRKSKAKYESLAEEYDRARTGDMTRRGGFGFKGPKSAAQQEEDLLRKVQASDEDYHNRVDTLSRERAELLATGRPEIIKALQDLVRECDGGMVLQVQKYASFSEKLLLSNGLSISPIKSAQKPDARSLREVVTSIDTERDLNNHLATFYTKVPPKTGEPKYERHAVLGGPTTSAAAAAAATAAPPQSSAGGLRSHQFSQSVSQPPATSSGVPPTFSSAVESDSLQTGPPPQTANSQMYGSVGQSGFRASAGAGGMTVPTASHERSFSYSSGFGGPSGAPTQQGDQSQGPQSTLQIRNASGPAGNDGASGYSPAGGPNNNNSGPGGPQANRFYNNSSMGPTGPPQLGALPFQTGKPDANGNTGSNPLMQHPPSSVPAPSQGLPPPTNANANTGGGAVQSRPMFGVSLDTLYERDSLAVPMVVYQCIQAVDLFGLSVEGIYRLSGSQLHVNKLKSMFDTDASSPALDFRNPEHFYHDVNSVASLLKQFFRDLPDPLLTRQHYDRFVEAAQHDDDTMRRDSLHAVINDLPDPNYATLRALVLHLNRVVENAHVTRMTSQNLAIVFGPTLMGAGSGDPEKGRWHVRVVDTILQNTYQIFDED